MWKRSNDPLREAIRNLIWLASRPPEDTVISFLSGYPFDRIKVPAESYYLFDSIRIILPILQPDTVHSDSVAASRVDEVFIRTGNKVEKVRLTPDSRPVMKSDTLKLNDSVYVLMNDFIPGAAASKHQ